MRQFIRNTLLRNCYNPFIDKDLRASEIKWGLQDKILDLQIEVAIFEKDEDLFHSQWFPAYKRLCRARHQLIRLNRYQRKLRRTFWGIVDHATAPY